MAMNPHVQHLLQLLRELLVTSWLYSEFQSKAGKFWQLYTVLESSRTSPRSRGSSRTILKSLVLALRVESLALASWLKSLEKPEDTLFTSHCMFCTNDFGATT